MRSRQTGSSDIELGSNKAPWEEENWDGMKLEYTGGGVDFRVRRVISFFEDECILCFGGVKMRNFRLHTFR